MYFVSGLVVSIIDCCSTVVQARYTLRFQSTRPFRRTRLPSGISFSLSLFTNSISKMTHPTFKKIPFSSIQSAFEISSTTLKEQQTFNTHHHSHHDISLLVPEFPHSKPEDSAHDPWILLSPWLDLISSSQRFNQETDIHRILLPNIFCTQVLRASAVALIMGRLATSDEEDLSESFPQTTTDGTMLDSLFSQNQTKKFFVRMDPCSLKDAVIGQGPVKNVKDLWTRLATSARGTTGIASLRSIESTSQHHVAEEQPVYMYLLPWRETMNTSLEYRVFCAPGGSGKISAISQYSWHKPWYHAFESDEKQIQVVQKVWRGVQDIHAEIMAHGAMSESLKERGFSFDVLDPSATTTTTEEAGGKMELIELNHSGAMSGCGSALFHWLDDARLLYGLKTPHEVEFRVTI